MPGSDQIVPEFEQRFAIAGAESRRRRTGQALDFSFNRTRSLDALVPATLKFTSDVTIVGVDRVVLAIRPVRFVLRLFERPLELTQFFRLFGALSFHCI
ncbi:hypothetical protein A1D31_38815 [Bradyrhizobium liaoningense]|nr:hypothetical protein A1D31_38815 [Bradyrhizobium liaoningense]